MISEINPSQVEKIEQFIQGVQTLATLLTEIRPAQFLESFQRSSAEKSMEAYAQTRRQWTKLFTDIVSELESQQGVLKKEIIDCTECIQLGKRAVAVFNGEEFKESVKNLAQFVQLVQRLKDLRDEGFLNEIVSTIRTL